MHEVGTVVDPDPSADPFGLDVLCQHGKLQPDTKKRTQIPGEVSPSIPVPPSISI